MKIRNIKIDSFRLFNEVEVDFVNPRQHERCANLVAIHAPNGFGKTSLFDAIEFCVTNNIQRLKTDAFNENLRSDKSENPYSSFIHNKENPDKEVYVKVVFEDGTDKERKVNPADEVRLLKGEPENSYFSDVMLSQDWFNRFLSATDASQRFEMFTRNFKDTDGLLEYYEQLKTARNIIGKYIAQKNRELQEEKKKLTATVDAQIIEHLDEAIKQLAEAGVDIEWNGSISDRQLENLTFQGDQRLFEAERELDDICAVVNNFEQVKNGQNGLIAIQDLPERLARINELDKTIQDFQQQLQNIAILKALYATIEKLSAEVAKYVSANKELEYLIQHYQAYKEVEGKINEILRHREAATKEMEVLGFIMKSKSQELRLAQEQYGGLLAESDSWKNKKGSLKEDYAQYQALLQQINQLGEEEQKANQHLAQMKPLIKEREGKMQLLLQMYNAVHHGAVDIEWEDYREVTKRILALSQNIKEKSALAAKLEQSIKEQKDYMGQVDALVVNAREMASTLKTGVCPLCGHDYGQLDALLEAIEGNQSLAKNIKEALRLKQEAEQALENARQERDALYRQLEDNIQKRIGNIEAAINQLLNSRQSVERMLVDIKNNRLSKEKRVATDYSTFVNLSEAQVLDIYNERLAQAEQRLTKSGQIKATIDAELQKTQSRQQQVSDELNALNEQFIVVQLQPEYSDYIHKLKERGESQPSEQVWRQQHEANNKSIAEFKERIFVAGEEKTRLEESGVSLAQEAVLTEQSNALSLERNALDTLYFSTIQFIRQACRIDEIGKDTPPETVSKQTEAANEAHVKRIATLDVQKKRLEAFRKLLEIAEQFNIEQKIKKGIADLEKQIERKTNQKNEVDAETEKLKDFLNDFVQSYFQLDLINKLYNTIDPHPNYKKVHFKCDFEQKKPRLNVIMESVADDSDKIVPNLYLSTAQINILSFCIFMAKAVFAKTDEGKDMDCIFVDDPIQALDDINILSMIDLLRNVAFTLDKQIVITTHDRNFFQLLQKKMPQDKFNACYWCLKERGKFSVVGGN